MTESHKQTHDEALAKTQSLVKTKLYLTVDLKGDKPLFLSPTLVTLLQKNGVVCETFNFRNFRNFCLPKSSTIIIWGEENITFAQILQDITTTMRMEKEGRYSHPPVNNQGFLYNWIQNKRKRCELGIRHLVYLLATHNFDSEIIQTQIKQVLEQINDINGCSTIMLILRIGTAISKEM